VRLNQIRDFVSVVEAGSLRAAARRLGISQPAMTKSIRSLETELQVELLRRTTRGVMPTPSGRAFLARARVVQTELRKAEQELARVAGEDGGTVAFGVAPNTGVLLAPDALARFRRDRPSARLRIVEGPPHALLSLVRDETLDFVVGQREGSEFDGALKFRPLCRTRLVVAGRRGHPLRRAKSLQGLADAHWLMFAPQDSPGMPFTRTFSAAGLPLPRSLVQCESYAVMFAMLAKTDALALTTPQFLAEPYVRGVLEEIPIDTPPTPLTIGMFTRADAPLTIAAAAMARAMIAAARALPRTP
jgi:LysR family transcriptional regulator, regulator of abg operon